MCCFQEGVFPFFYAIKVLPLKIFIYVEFLGGEFALNLEFLLRTFCWILFFSKFIIFSSLDTVWWSQEWVSRKCYKSRHVIIHNFKEFQKMTWERSFTLLQDLQWIFDSNLLLCQLKIVEKCWRKFEKNRKVSAITNITLQVPTKKIEFQ